jgi:hypothetical protein
MNLSSEMLLYMFPFESVRDVICTEVSKSVSPVLVRQVYSGFMFAF